jgi:hypothetical protein
LPRQRTDNLSSLSFLQVQRKINNTTVDIVLNCIVLSGFWMISVEKDQN